MEKRRIKTLHEQYTTEIAGTYDRLNRGSYFHYDREANKDNGIGGDDPLELRKKGNSIILEALAVLSPNFRKLEERFGRIKPLDSKMERHLSDLRSGAHGLSVFGENHKSGLDNGDLYFMYDLFERLKAGDFYPRKEFGEMAFHQVRINEIGHACGCPSYPYAHFTCGTLDKILDQMYSGFLGDRRKEFGEALARELLCQTFKYITPPLPAQKALNAIEKYGVDNETLIVAAEQALILEANHYGQVSKIQRQMDCTKRDYEEQRKRNLSTIGATPFFKF